MVAFLSLFLGKREQSDGKRYQGNGRMVLALSQMQKQKILNDLLLRGHRIEGVEREHRVACKVSIHRRTFQDDRNGRLP